MLTTSVERRLADAERENDQLRRELEDRRREEERAADERERERRAAIRRNNPSNRLYNGEIRSFREAIEAHIAALRNERNGSWAAGDDEESVKYRADFDGYIASAEALRREYISTIGVAERALFETWAAEPNGSMKQVTGQCGLTGDFSPLAI